MWRSGTAYGKPQKLNTLKRYAAKDSVPTQVSDLTNDAKYQTEEQVTAAINSKVSSVYKPGGSVAFSDLIDADAEHLGMVYNVTNKFTTTEDFVEGAGQKHPAGTNVVIVEVDGEYKYDVLAGFVDLSALAEKEQVDADIETAKTDAVAEAATATDEKLKDYVKAEDIEVATEAEILALFADSSEEA